MPSEPIKGSCLCGSIRFEIKPPLSVFRYCHCSRCRKATGSAHAANVFLPQEQINWTAGEELINRFDLPGAQRFAVWFCGRCGSRVPHKVRGGNDYLVPAGLLDDDLDMRPENCIFWGSRPSWYVEPSELPRFAERP